MENVERGLEGGALVSAVPYDKSLCHLLLWLLLRFYLWMFLLFLLLLLLVVSLLMKNIPTQCQTLDAANPFSLLQKQKHFH